MKTTFGVVLTMIWVIAAMVIFGAGKEHLGLFCLGIAIFNVVCDYGNQIYDRMDK